MRRSPPRAPRRARPRRPQSMTGRGVCSSSGKWRLAIAERPALGPRLDEIDDYVLAAHAGLLRQIVDDRAIVLVLLFERTVLGAVKLDHHKLRRVRDAEK